jgi:hypothetical protein
MRQSLRIATCVLALAVGAPRVSAAVRVDVRKVTLQGQPAPLSNGDDAVFATLQPAMINNQGDVAFAATLTVTSGEAAHNSGIWATNGGALANRVRKGQLASGANPDGSASFSSFNDVTLNDAGAVAFLGRTNQSAYSQGYWVSSPATTVPVAVRGTPVIGYDWQYDGLYYQPALNGQGQVAFNLSIQPAGSSSSRGGIFVNDATTASPVALQGESAPGFTGTFSDIFRVDPPINESGETAFAIGLVGSSPESNSAAIYAGSSQSLRLVAQIGSPAPGTDANYSAFFSTARLPINVHGDTAFAGELQGGGVTSANNQGLWRTRGENVELVVQKGDLAWPAAEGSAAAVFSAITAPLSAFFYRGVIDDTDQLVFAAELSGDDVTDSNRTTLWTVRENKFTLLARTGAPAPGTEDLFTALSTYATNRSGQVAFRAAAGGKAGIWAQDPGGQLRLIVRVGDQVEIAPGELHAITAIDETFASFPTSTGSDGRPRVFNDRGEIVFDATLDDGRKGIFVSDAAAHFAADFDRDGAVDGADLVQWNAAYGHSGAADADGDGDSDAADFLVWQRELTPPSAAAAVPEPASLTLTAFLLSTARRIRQRGRAGRRQWSSRVPYRSESTGPSVRCGY